MKRHLVFLAGLMCVAMVCLWHAQPSYGQAASATIRGTVLDPQGKAVPKAKVTARKVDTGQERGTTTSDEGIYVIPSLAPGVYDMRVEATGFNRGEVKGMNLEVGAIRDVNFNLALAGVTTEVKVSAAPPLVETTKTDVSTVINDKQMEGLPVLNTTAVSPLNDYAQLAQNTPGVHFDFSNNSFDLIGPGAYNDRGNLVNIDGGNISDQVVSTRDVLGASLSEVKEFQIITSSYNAEYGQAGSLIINVVTKSGTNAFHGNAFAAFRGRNLGASNYFYNEFDPAAAFRRAPFQKQNWGVNAGGPFIKDKTFWFVNFEKVHQSVPLTLTNQAPDFAHSVTVDQPTNEILWSAKVDHRLSQNHQLSLRINFDRQLFDNDLVQISHFASPASLTSLVINDNTFNAGLVSTVTPRVVNEARFFWHRFLTLLPTKSTVPGQRGSDFYLGAAFCCPQGGRQNRYQFVDNLTWSRGTHTIKSGVNISDFPYFSLFQQFHFGVWEGFPSPGATLSPTTCNTSTGSTPTSNCPNTFTFASGPGAVHTGDVISGLYVQDSWKIRQNLTLNYGIRYDYENGAFRGGTVEKPGGGCFQANGIIPACSSDNNNWQPRVGLAWSPAFESGFLHAVFGGPDRSVIRASIAEVTELAYLNISLDSLNFDGVTLLTSSLPVTTGTSGLLQYFPGTPPASALALLSGPSGTFFGRTRPISDHLRNPESRHLSFDVTRQLRNDYVVHLGYIGVLGFGQFGERDVNFPAILADPAHAGFFYFGARPNPSFGAIRMQENSRSSAYHGGYIQVQKRYGHHFQAQGSYTFSKTLSSTEDFYGTSEPGDPRNIRAERGLAHNDVRHLGNFSFVVDTNGLVTESFLKHVVNDWSIGIIGLLHSGTPYPISTGEGPFTGSVFFGVGAESSQRPNVLPDGTLIATNIASNSGANLAVGPNGAVTCGCPQTTFLAPAGANPSGPVDSFVNPITLKHDLVDFQFLNGNLARNVGMGDPFYRFDLGIGKTFHVGERIGLEFRADIVNLFNHPNFILFNGADVLDAFSIGPAGCRSCIDSSTGKYIGSSGQVLHLSDLQHGKVSKDLTNPVFTGLGDPTAAGDPRIFQLQFKIKW